MIEAVEEEVKAIEVVKEPKLAPDEPVHEVK